MQQVFANSVQWHGETALLRKGGEAGTCEVVALPIAEDRALLALAASPPTATAAPPLFGADGDAIDLQADQLDVDVATGVAGAGGVRITASSCGPKMVSGRAPEISNFASAQSAWS